MLFERDKVYLRFNVVLIDRDAFNVSETMRAACPDEGGSFEVEIVDRGGDTA